VTTGTNLLKTLTLERPGGRNSATGAWPRPPKRGGLRAKRYRLEQPLESCSLIFMEQSGKVLLAGCGFLGSHVVKELQAAGHPVCILDRAEGPARLFPDVPFVRGDIADRTILGKFLADVSTVVYAAGTTIPATRDVRFDIESNVLTCVDFLDECVRVGVKKVVYFSSGGSVYGVPQRIPIPEDHPTNPISVYGASKLTVEKYLRVYRVSHGLNYIVLRISNAYGERQPVDGKQGIIASFLHKLNRGEPLSVWGDGAAVKDYIYVGDVAKAVAKSLAHHSDQSVFNIGSGRGLSVRQLLDVLGQVTGRRIEVRYEPARSFDVPANVLDCTLARQEWAWKPEISIEEGVERSWNWIRSLGELQ
jgi:UDP-glucose 4-epimerase